MRPVSYISRVPKKNQIAGRPKNSVKRSDEELIEGVSEWIDVKFRRPEKRELMSRLWAGEWSSELVVNVVKSEAELDLIAGHGIKVLRLKDILTSLTEDSSVVRRAGGADFVDLILGYRL